VENWAGWICNTSFSHVGLLPGAGIGDLIHAVWATEYFDAMLKAKVPNTEIHIYASGNHGGGLTVSNTRATTLVTCHNLIFRSCVDARFSDV